MNRNLIFILIIIFFYSCAGPAKQDERSQVRPEKVVVIDSLLHPWSIAFLNETEVLISEKDGNLISANIENKEKTKIKGFPSDLVDSIRIKDFRDNSGIFEVLLHPQFEDNKLIYVSYAAKSNQGTTTKIIKAELENDSLKNIQEIFLATPFRRDLFHYGGGMTFGKDGKLYFTIGERYLNEIEQPKLPIAQDLKDKRGKIHRLNTLCNK